MFTPRTQTALRILACPLDHTKLSIEDNSFVCKNSHNFRVESGIPVFTDNPRHEQVPLNMDPCPHTNEKGRSPNDSIDWFVNDWIVNTNGNLYWHLRGKLPRYPIPTWRFGCGDRKVLVDLGCGWGRWSIAAARAGFEPIGVDIHVDGLAAASRVTRQLGVQADFVCCDAERLPFQQGTVDWVFSYSVLQHLDKLKVRRILQELFRVLKPGGTCLIQLPNKFGLMSIVRQLKRGFHEPESGTFEMRYWSRNSIRRYFKGAGLVDVVIHADGFFSQNPQLSDLDLLSPMGKLVVLASHVTRKTADAVPFLTHFADSLWIEARAPSG